MKSIKNILGFVKTAGDIAIIDQQKLNFNDRRYKNNGSILTEVDKKVEEYLFNEISHIYPDANILTEETKRFFDPQKPYTFAIDPIDGTDVFSQGMPSWCISVGLLNKELNPVAGIVFAPKWGSLFFADICKKATHNGKEISLLDKKEIQLSKTEILVNSNIHKYADLREYQGKLLNFGSAVLHLCFPLIYKGVSGVILTKVHIWDLVASHAINLSIGIDFEFFNGRRIDYSELIDGSAIKDIIIAGPKQFIGSLRKTILPI